MSGRRSVCVVNEPATEGPDIAGLRPGDAAIDEIDLSRCLEPDGWLSLSGDAKRPFDDDEDDYRLDEDLDEGFDEFDEDLDEDFDEDEDDEYDDDFDEDVEPDEPF